MRQSYPWAFACEGMGHHRTSFHRVPPSRSIAGIEGPIFVHVGFCSYLWPRAWVEFRTGRRDDLECRGSLWRTQWRLWPFPLRQMFLVECSHLGTWLESWYECGVLASVHSPAQVWICPWISSLSLAVLGNEGQVLDQPCRIPHRLDQLIVHQSSLPHLHHRTY